MVDFDVVITPSFMQAENWRKDAARGRREGLFGQTVTTFDAWIADLWELYGDGRTLIDGVRREVMLHALCQQAGGLVATPGVAPMAAACMRNAAGLSEFERAVSAAGQGEEVCGLSSGEISFLGLLARYESTLDAAGYVETGQAASALARNAECVFLHPMRILIAQDVASSWIARRFLEAIPEAHIAIQDDTGVQVVEDALGIDVRFALPSGMLAEAGVVADLACEYGEEGDVVVSCKDPLGMYNQVEQRLAGAGMNVGVQASKPFSQTDFGRAFLAMYHCLHDDPFDTALLADAVGSPFSGFSLAQARYIDKRLRGDRLADRASQLAELRAVSDRFSQLEELASDPDADVLIGVFEQAAQSMAGYSSAWRAEQLSAMSTLRGAMAAARGMRAGIGACVGALESASVGVSFVVEGDGPSVTFMPQGGAARLGRGRCATLVIADYTTEAYPASDKEDAASTMLEKLGLAPEDSALEKARRTLRNLLRVPTKRIVFVRPLADAAADEAYPAAALEEFIGMRASQSPDGAHEGGAHGLPAVLCENLLLRGEEDLYANECALPPAASQDLRVALPWPKIDALDAVEVRKCAPYRRDSQGRLLDKPCPSPSQVESYLACPLQWFANSRVRLDELEEGFGPLERGTFAHEALERFYRRFQATGHQKVSSATIEEARSLMREVLGELKAEQYDEARKGENRLVPCDELERREVEVLCDQLVAYLDFEAKLLPTFHPAYLEYAIDADQPADYAGAYLVGKVDRIDVDDNGRAVIIDYKGSVDSEHEIAGKTSSHAGKVQTRMYAQVIKRLLGLEVVGALYVTYGRNPVVSGAYDSSVLDAVHLPGIAPRKCGCAATPVDYDLQSDDFAFSKLSFDQVLDATEVLASQVIDGMCSGAIAPDPVGNACKYCPVLCCEKRGA